MINDRIAERRREVRDERRRARRRRTIWAAAVLVVVAVFVMVERSELVALDDIQVHGTNRLEVSEVLAASGLELGTSTLRLRLGSVEERVVGLPLVEEATARRVDPLTVSIEVIEREPAVVAAGGGEQVLIDRSGVVLVHGRLDTLPLIELTGTPPEPGRSVADDPALANAHAVWQGLSGPLRAEVARYTAVDTDQLTLTLERGIEVRFGRADRVDEKVRALGRILEDVGDTPIVSIDVRAPTAPVVTGP